MMFAKLNGDNILINSHDIQRGKEERFEAGD